MYGCGRVGDQAMLVAAGRARVLPGLLLVGVGPLAHVRPADGGRAAGRMRRFPRTRCTTFAIGVQPRR
jgi:hypothetical protein